MEKRPVDMNFIKAMEEKLEYGREKGRVGWDTYWKETTFPETVFEGLQAKFYEEVSEVLQALTEGNDELAADECVDVGNLAMMMWDFIHQTKDMRD